MISSSSRSSRRAISGRRAAITRQPRGEVGREQLGEFGIERVRGGADRAIDRNPHQLLGALDILAALRRDQELEALTRAVDAHRQVDLARDRHRLLEQERRRGIAQGIHDAPARGRELRKIRKSAHQAPFAAAAFQHLRFEHVPRPLQGFRRPPGSSMPRGGKPVTAARHVDAATQQSPWRRNKAFPSISGQSA